MKVIALTLGAFLFASTAAMAGPCLGGHESAEKPAPTVGT
jgi:hypothetical protein